MTTPLTREQFESAYRHYMDSNGYSHEPYDVIFEWDRYSRGRSWFLYTFHEDHAFAVGQMLANRG